MKLYHGTTGRILPQVLQQGLVPRADRKGKSRWKHAPSHTQAIYLTDSYAPYFADMAHTKGNTAIVVEIDSDKLKQHRLVPDEDAVAHANREKGDDIFDLVKKARKDLPNWRGNDRAWRESLQVLGTCAYLGVIPPEAITRIVQVADEDVWLWMATWDVTVSPINQHILGDVYRAQTARLFNDEPTVLPTGWQADRWKVKMPAVEMMELKDGRISKRYEIAAKPDERAPIERTMAALREEQRVEGEV